jgi:hypothetical protein
MRAAGAAVAVMVMLASGGAWAQSNPQAEKLFRDAKALMKQGQEAEACDLFEASQRLEANVATLASLADCREKTGRVASAWGFFVDVERLTRGNPAMTVLNDTAKRRAAALEPHLSYLTINVADDVRVDGLVVRRNHEPVDPAVWNRAVPVDGGDHEIEAEAPGQEPWSTRVSLANQGDHKAVEVPKFKEIKKVRTAALPHPEIMVAEEPAPIMTTRRKVAVGLTVGGVAALIAGAVLGSQVDGLENDAATTCPRSGCSPDDARRANQLIDDANRRALESNIAVGVGVAAVAGAAFLWITGAPEEATPAGVVGVVPRVSPGYAGFAATIRF